MLSKKLRMLRERHGLTQKQIADILNIDRSTYSYYEIGKSYPTLDTLIKLARIFRVTTDKLLGFEGKSPVPPPRFADNMPPYGRTKDKEIDTVSELPLLTPDEQNLVLAYRILTETQKRDIFKSVQEQIRRNDEA